MTEPIDLVLERLRDRGCNPQRKGAGWKAHCPAHDDRVPSLTVDENAKRDALVHCHANCEPDSVLAELNLTKSDLFAKRTRSSSAKRIAETYDYTDEHGKLLFQVVRYEPKEFRQRRPDGRGGWIYALDDTRRVLYYLPEVRAAVERNDTIYVVEGEKDADRLVGEGVVATTSPMGAGKWRREYAEQLASAAHVVVVADRDEPGRKHARQVASSLVGRVGEVTVVEVAEGKDITDHLDGGHTLDELRPVDYCAAIASSESGSDLLDDVTRFVRRFVVLDDEQCWTVAAWITHVHAIDVFYTTPRLMVSSPEAECGKTLLVVDVMAPLLVDPIVGVSVSPAALYRTLETRTTALLLDELDKTLGRRGAADSETAAMLLAIMNSGYRRGQYVTVCVGSAHQPARFPTFAPAAFAGIHAQLDFPFISRSILISMDRKLPDEPVDELEWSAELAAECEALRVRLAAWAAANLDALRAARPERPPAMRGRKAECWGPLLRVGAVAGGEWPGRIRLAFEALSLGERDDRSNGLRWLADMRTIFGDDERLFTETICARLNSIVEAPWPRWNDGKGISGYDIGRFRRQYKLHPPVSMRIETDNRKGYEREWFLEAWTRYVPSGDVGDSVTEAPGPDPGPLPGTSVTTLGEQANLRMSQPSQPPPGDAPHRLHVQGRDGVTDKSSGQSVTEFETEGDDLVDDRNADPLHHLDRQQRIRAIYGTTGRDPKRFTR